MGKKDKSKKGKGVVKTVRKLQHKLEKTIIKAEKKSGEQPIAQLLCEFHRKQQGLKGIIVAEASPPSPRSHFSLTASPDSNELILFGGEYFDGQKTTMFSDLFLYHCKDGKWVSVNSANTPPPRSGHHAVYVKGVNIPASLWIFGGEYASPTQLRFQHYRDLWTLHIRTRKWDRVKFEGPGPCARSGHRMLFWKNSIMLFGGFSDTGSKTIYFDDVWEFNLKSSCWSLVKLTGEVPIARSACSFFPSMDSKSLYVFLGYRKENLAHGVEKGVVCADYLRMTMEKDHHGTSAAVRMSGTLPRPLRGAMGSTLQSPNRALLFGGVYDEERDGGETVFGHFYNDLYVVDLDKARWHVFNYASEQKSANIKKPPVPAQLGASPTSDSCTFGTTSQLSNGVFALTLQNNPVTCSAAAPPKTAEDFDRVGPSPRSSPGIAVLNSTLYVYGGVYEVGDRRITLDDFYCLDLNRPVSWTCLYSGSQSEQEWFGSDLEDSDEESRGEDDESVNSDVETTAAAQSQNMEIDSDSSTDGDGDDGGDDKVSLQSRTT